MSAVGWFEQHLNRQLIPALCTIFDPETGGVDVLANKHYVAKILGEKIAGVALLCHTGRGPYLTPAERQTYLEVIIPEVHAQGKIVIVGVGSTEQAREAQAMGADALLAFPCTAQVARNPNQRLLVVTEYHQELAAVGLPVMAFLLYEAAGGVDYTVEEIRGILAIENVGAIKFALMNNLEKLEDIFLLIIREFPDTVLVTGEDRMLAESIEKARDISWGYASGGSLISNMTTDQENTIQFKIGALLGMGQVFPLLQLFILRTFDHAAHLEFYRLIRAMVGKMAKTLFCRPEIDGATRYDLPMERYIMNTLYATIVANDLPRQWLYDPAADGSQVESRAIPGVVHQSTMNQLVELKKLEIETVCREARYLENLLWEKLGRFI